MGYNEDKSIVIKKATPEVGDLVELDKEYNATKGARAVVLSVRNNYINIRWIDKRDKGKRYNQDNGEYDASNFNLLETIKQ